MLAHKMNQISIAPRLSFPTLNPSDGGNHLPYKYAKHQSACSEATSRAY